MDAQIDVFALADKRLAWAQRRQELLAQNIANASTPGWKARDIKPFAALLSGQAMALAPVGTEAGHIALKPADSTAVLLKGERAPDGNMVKLDDQLTRVADTETTHSMVANVYAKYMSFSAWRSGAEAMDLTTALTISARGMEVQTTRLRVIAENLANQDTTGSTPGADPYRRKTVSFANEMDRELGAATVRVKTLGRDGSAFPQRYDPGHPAADARGYVRTPNVNSFIEVMDMREAERSYNANLSVMQVSRGMLSRTIEMLK